MGFRIRYLRDGKYVDDFHWDKSLSEARVACADNASILNMENKQQLVATVSRQSLESPCEHISK